MTRDQRKLLKALRRRDHVTSLQVRMANIVLQCNGIMEALEYVADIPDAPRPATEPQEAKAEQLRLETNQ